MPASVWSGYLTFGLISLPVRLSSGARGERVSFHMLHREDLVRVKQQLICPVQDVVVDRKDTVKGYEYRKGQYVVIDPEEIKAIEPKTAKAMEIVQFVKAEEVDPVYFETSYYLTPDEAGRRPYALLVKAMRGSGFLAIAKITMHNREYTAFLRPFHDGLMLHTMYYQDEVRIMESFGTENIEVREAELKMARQLIEALAGPFHPEEFHDTFQDNLKQLIADRLEGKQVTPVEKPAKMAPVVDLMDALKQSLARAEKKPPQSERAPAHTAAKKNGARSSKPKKRAA